ncbi:unnamed protein product [Cuscuta epithymum]|uniref:Reverse transcriptase domain-containing protein n=1 Tax=Cuscuta epithymum TaxID=186058 RepID=A0AAV0CU28_9ASTE|nr:unnamed protein product [Cuscuta epithymum]CAH9143897.1 unnamed protein product [Cuscuta epithymum]
MGDFNDMLHLNEKRGRVEHPQWLINGFREVVRECDLVDIPLQGRQFTWWKSLGTEDAIEERLDRAMGNNGWLDMFPLCRLTNLVTSHSDHSPILLETEAQTYIFHRRQFKFENSWLTEQELNQVVERGWLRGADDPILERLNLYTKELDTWGRKLRRRYKEAIDRCKSRIAELRELETERAGRELLYLRERLSLLLIQEEQFWKQRAKVFWMRDGDMNTKFFHVAATTRKKRNMILKLQRDDGTVATTRKDLCEVGGDYFRHLFTASPADYDLVTSAIQRVVTEDDNKKLIGDFSDNEFKEALSEMHSDKAPGPDGLNPAFYKRFWELCGRNISIACRTWLAEGTLPASMGETNIVLIPKSENPSSMKDFRPISLCNVVYKILAKVLANRLKSILPKCISKEQSGFVSGRFIMDNVLVASEIIHYLKCKTRGIQGAAALKIDIIKAYDRIDWGYLFYGFRNYRFLPEMDWMDAYVCNFGYIFIAD